MSNIAVKKPRKKKSKMYFGTPAQEAIIEYCATEDMKEKNKIFRERLEYPFMKLAENLIHTYKFYYFDVDSTSVQKDVVGFMVMNMHKYDPTKGRAFSYFSIVAKNWLILNNNNNYKRYKQHTQLDSPTALASLGIGSDHDRQNDIEDANEFTEIRSNSYFNIGYKGWANTVRVFEKLGYLTIFPGGYFKSIKKPLK